MITGALCPLCRSSWVTLINPGGSTGCPYLAEHDEVREELRRMGRTR